MTQHEKKNLPVPRKNNAPDSPESVPNPLTVESPGLLDSFKHPQGRNTLSFLNSLQGEVFPCPFSAIEEIPKDFEEVNVEEKKQKVEEEYQTSLTQEETAFKQDLEKKKAELQISRTKVEEKKCELRLPFSKLASSPFSANFQSIRERGLRIEEEARKIKDMFLLYEKSLKNLSDNQE